MSEPTLEKPAVVDAPADIKKFTPSNKAIEDLSLSDEQIQRRDAEQVIVQEREAEAKAVKAAEEKANDLIQKPDAKPADGGKDKDFVLPDDDGFGLDSPLEMGTIKTTDKSAPKLDDSEKEQKREQNATLRAQVEEANARAIEAENRIKGVEEDYRGRMIQMEKALEETQRKLTFQDPSEHPQVQELLAPWDRDLDALAQQISLNGGNGKKLKLESKEIIRQFRALGDPQSEGFDDRRDSLINQIDKDFPDDRKEIIALMSKGVSIFGESERLMRDIAENGSKFQQAETQKIYDVILSDYEKAEKNFFNPSQEMIDSDPAHHRVLMKQMKDGNPAVAERADKIVQFSRFALNPLPPVSESELRGMGMEEQAQYLERRRVQHSLAQREVRDTFAESRMALTLLPVMAEEVAELRGIIQQMRDATPAPKDEDGNVIVEDDDEPTDEERRAGIRGFDPGHANINLD